MNFDLPDCAAPRNLISVSIRALTRAITGAATTESSPTMESFLRRAAKEGAVQKVASLLERSVVNLFSVDKVRGWVGCVVRGWPTW